MGIGGCVHPFATGQFLIIGKSTWVFVVHLRNNGIYTGRKNATASAMKAPFTLFAKGYTFHSQTTKPRLSGQRGFAPPKWVYTTSKQCPVSIESPLPPHCH